MSGKILILAETGFIIRNLLLGKFPNALSKDIHIIAAVPNPKDPLLLQLGLERIEFIHFPHAPPSSITNYSRFKRIFNLPHVMYRIVEGFHNNSSRVLQSKLFDSLNSRWYLSGVWILNIFGKLLLICRLRGLFEKCIFALVKKSTYYRQWDNILKEHNPDLLISTMLTLVGLYRYSADLPAVLAATDRKIKTGSIVQSWDNVTTKPFIVPKSLIRYWTWSDFMNGQLLEYHQTLRPESLKIIGGLQFDFHLKSGVLNREEYLTPLEINPDIPYILFTPGTRRTLPFEDVTFINLIKLLISKKLEVQYVIRLHPKDYGHRWKQYRNFLTDNKIVVQTTSLDIPMDSGGICSPKNFYKNQINIIYHAAVVVNTSSTTTVDAAIMDKPVINTNFHENDDGLFKQNRATTYIYSTHFKPISTSGGVFVANNHEECYRQILTYMKNPSQLELGRKKIARTVTNIVDGKTGERLARDVESIVL